MNIDDFTFDLPQDRIALRPVKPRDHARLLIIKPEENLLEDRFYNLKSHLRAGDVLVLNNTRVIPAALFALRKRREEAGQEIAVHINLHKQISPNRWRAFLKPARRIHLQDCLYFIEKEKISHIEKEKISQGKIPEAPVLKARVIEKKEGGEVWLDFSESGEKLEKLIQNFGVMPLPPYIAGQRPADLADQSDYQTVFAQRKGSVAAPTAGLHFTDQGIQGLKKMGVQFASVTLHVGAGTFLPVKTEKIETHKMHAEWREIPPETVNKIREAKERGNRIICVGTTALRSLESAVGSEGELVAQAGETDIFIQPEFHFQIADGLITNFHLPRSTLFILTAAFSGIKRVKQAYFHAISNHYRFYSYGDACLLWR